MRVLSKVARSDEAERQTAREGFTAYRARLLTEGGKSAAAILTPAQSRRLGQVLFQLRGIEVFEIEQFSDALQLTVQQQLALRQVRVELEAAARQLAMDKAARKISTEEFDQKVAARLDLAFAQTVPHLSDKQLLQVNTWAGKPIEFSRQELRLEIRETRKRSQKE